VPVSALRICASARWVAGSALDPLATRCAVDAASAAFDRLAELATELAR
jgi:hypothetical protein